MSRQQNLRILGLSGTATPEDIKAAYRRRARENHPDINPGDPEAAERFRQAAEAYRALMEQPASSSLKEAASSVYETVWEKAGAAFSRSRGADLRYELWLELAESMRGGHKTIQVPRPTTCPTCSGTGAKPGSAPALCTHCGGSGQVVQKLGFIERKITCQSCGGKGRRILEPCEHCGGSGQVEQPTPLAVKIPPGVDEGTRLRIEGKGGPGRSGGGPGDLFVVIRLKPHPILTRKGHRITVEVPISFAEAALGTTVQVPTPADAVRVQVPPGSWSGRRFRVDLEHGFHLEVELTIEVPEGLTEEVKSLLRSYAEAESQFLPRRARFREQT